VADDDGFPLPECRDQRDHIADRIEDAVGRDVDGCAGAPKAAHIGCNDVKAGLSQTSDLMSPGIGQFRPAVTKQHQWTSALLE
jgi:hypothetical protein